MEYCEICLVVPPDALEAVTHLLHKAGTGGVVIDDESRGEVRAYLPRDERLSRRLAALRQELEDLVAFFPGMSELRQTERFVADEDWANAWREHFHPMRIGRRLLVAPTWEAVQPRSGELVLRLDPGMAFGTGTHASTVLCLRALEELIRPGCTVLDVGTGSGILAVAAAMLGAGAVTALDIDPLAVRIARQNVVVNGV
jgi:ribosomal protein L11 methyltransferase